MLDARNIIEQLLEETRYPWEYVKIEPSGNTVPPGIPPFYYQYNSLILLGVVWYSRHCPGGSFSSSFNFSIKDETTLNLNECGSWVKSKWVGNRKFSIDLAQPDSFQLISECIREMWDTQQPERLPIHKARDYFTTTRNVL